ncbi:LptE family protein [Zunongwangia pacifica]|uniref:LPS assembly lipoprotein LptE n=1 Tax=Zunongwangia pacifica TaxID=2911062 RepID=A0A9X1ZWI7_9FLAO|nr:LptE family protein [Zunongwangia pacifica]MCL6218660.1 LPS assembly lipoprotein LptE [Zunongwangia pacifica]
MKKLGLILSIFSVLTLVSCGIYSFTGASTGDAKSFQVNNFQNTSDLIEPGIERTFKLNLQDLIQNQTNLTLTNNNADLIFEGEIIDYYISPMTATAQNTAAQNRLTIAVQVRYYNTLEPEKDFDRRFSFYYDYDARTQLVGGELNTAIEEIYNRITQDIFNAALTDW